MANTPQFHANLLITADAKQAIQSLESLQNSITKLVSSSIKGSGLGSGITKELQEAQAAAAKLQVSLHQATNLNTGKLDLTRFSDSLKKSNLDLQDVYKHLSSFGNEGQKAFLQLTNSIASAEVPLKRTSKMFDDLWTTMKNTAKWQLTSSMMHGFVGAVQSAYGYAQDLNKSLNDIRIVTGYNTNQMAKFAKTANDAAKALSTTTTRYTDAALIYYQQGLPESDIKARTDATIKMANVTGEAARDVSNYMTAIWNNFDNGSKSLEYYADVMTALGAATASSTDEIATGLEKFAAVSETVGLSYEYATSALATITAETRQNADVVGNALKTLFSRIQGLNLGETADDGTTLNKYSQALAKVGVDIKDTSGEIRAMDEILDDLGSKWNNLSNDTKLATAQTVAGVRQYTQLIAFMDNWDVFKNNLSIAQNSSGTLDKQAEIYAESWEAASNRVRAAWEGIYDSIFDDDFFISVTDGFAGILKGIENVTDAMGGMKGIAFGLGAVLTKVLGKQMAQSLSNAAYGIKGLFGINQKDAFNFQKQALNLAIEKSYDSDDQMGYLKNTLLKDQIGLKSRLLDIQEDLTLQQKLEAESLISIKQMQGEQLVTARQRVLDNEERRRQESLNLYNFTRGNGLDYTEISNSVDNWLKTRGSITSLLDETEKAFNQGDTKKVQEKIAAIKKQTNTSYLKNVINNGQYRVENWHKVQNKGDFDFFRQDVENVLNEGQNNQFLKTLMGNLKVKKDDSRYTELRGLIENLLNGRLEGEELETAYKKLYTAYKNSNEDALKSFDEIQNRAKSLSTNIVSLTNSFTSLGFAISSIRGIQDIINDETLSSWEKFSSIAVTTAMTLPSAIQGISEFYNSSTGIIDSIKAVKDNRIIEALMSKDGGGYTLADATELLSLGKSGALTEGVKGFTDLAKASNIAKSSIKSSMWVFAKYAVIIAAVAGVIALVVKAHQEMYESSPAGQLEKATKKAAELNEVLNDTLQVSSDLKKSIEDYDGAVKSLEECTKGTQEWRDSLQEANNKALDLLNTFGHLGLEYEKDPSTGLITITNSEKIQQEMDKRTTAVNIAKINGDQDVLEKGYENDLSNYADKIYDYLSDGYRSSYIKGGIETARHNITKYFEDNFDDFQQLPEDDLIPILSDKIKNDFYDPSTYGSADGFKNSLDDIINHVADIVISTDNLTEALNANTEVNRLRQENELGKYLNKDEYREGELAITNAIYQNAIDTETNSLVNTLTAQAQINRALSGDAETLWNEFVQIKGLEGIELAGNAVIGDKNSRIIKGQMVQDDGSLKEVEYLATTIAETIAAYRKLESVGVDNTTALNLLNTGGKALGSFAANGNLESAAITDVSKILSIINNNNIFKQQLESIFGTEWITELENQANKYAETVNSIWENNLYGSLNNQTLDQFKNLGVSASQEILNALNETFKYGGQETQDLLVKILGDAGDKAGEVAKIFNNIDWSSGDAMDQFIAELKLLGIELDSVDASNFEAAMAAIADSLPIDDVDTLINKIKELYGIIKDVDKGSIVDEDTYKKLIAAGANPDDFIETSDGYLATKDVKSSDVTNYKDDFNRMSELYHSKGQQDYLNTLDPTLSIAEQLNSGDIAQKKNRIWDILEANNDSQELKDYLGIGNLLVDQLTEDDINTALNRYGDLLNRGQAGQLEQSWYNQQEQLTAGSLTEMRQMDVFDTSTEATQNALHAYALEGGEDYAAALAEYERALAEVGGKGEKAAAATANFYNAIKKIENNKAAATVHELIESLDEVTNESERQKQLQGIADEIKNVYGVEVDTKFVDEHLNELDRWSKGVEGSSEEIQRLLIETDEEIAKRISDLSLSGIDDEQLAEARAAIDNFYNGIDPVTLKVTGEADFTQLAQQLLSIGVPIQDVANLLTSIGHVELDENGWAEFMSALTLMFEALECIESPSLAKEGQELLNQARAKLTSMGFNAILPSEGNVETTDYSGGGSGRGGSSEELDRDTLTSALSETYEKKRDRLKAQYEGLSPDEASKYIKEEIALLEEEQKILEEQIKTWKSLLKTKVQEFNQEYADELGFDLTLNDDGEIANLSEIYQRLIQMYDEGNTDLADKIYDKLQESAGIQASIDEAVQGMMDKEREQAELELKDITDRIDWRIKQIDYQIKRLNYYQEKLLIQAHGNKQTIEAMLEGFQYQEQEMLKLFEKGDALRQGIDELNAAKAKYPNHQQMFNEQILEYQSDLIDVNQDILELRADMEELVQEVLELALDEIDIQNERINKYISMLDRFQNIIDLSGRSILDQALKVEIGTTKLDTLINKMSISKQTMEGLAEATRLAQDALEKRAADGDETSVSMWENQIEELERELEAAQDDFLANWEEVLQAAADIFDMRVELTVQTLEQALSPFSSLDILEDRYNKEKELQEKYLDDATKLYELNKLNRQLNQSITDENDLLAKSKLRDIQEEILAYQKAGVDMSQYDLDILQKKYDLRLAEIALMEAQNSKTSMRLIRDAAGNWTYAYDADQTAIDEALQSVEDATYSLKKASTDYIDEMTEEMIAIKQEFIEAIGGLDRNSADYMEQLLYLQQHYMKEYNVVLGEFKKGVEGAGLTIHDTWYGATLDLYNFEDAQKHFSDASDLAISELMVNYKDWQKVVEQAMGVAGTSWENFGDDTGATLDSLEEHIQALCDEISKLVDVLMEYVATSIGMVEEWQSKYSKQVDAELARNEAYINNDSLHQSRSGGGKGFEMIGDDLSYNMTAYIALYGQEGLNDPEFLKMVDLRNEKLKDMQEDLKSGKVIATEDIINVLTESTKSETALGSDIADQSTGVKYTKQNYDSSQNGSYEAKTTQPLQDFINGYLKNNGLGAGGSSNPLLRHIPSPNQNFSYQLGLKNKDYYAGTYNPQSGWCAKWVGDVFEYNGDNFARGNAWDAVRRNGGTAYNGQYIANGTAVGSQSGEYGHIGIYSNGYIYGTSYTGNSLDRYTIDEWQKKYGKLYITNATSSGAAQTALNVFNQKNGNTYGYSLLNHIPGLDNNILLASNLNKNPLLNHLPGYDTGGYTGTWGPYGRLALLHEKELVLNKADTSNILDAVKISRGVDDKISDMIAFTNNSLRDLLSYIKLPTFETQPIEQTVQIQAEFPGVTDQYEIQEALSNLSNDASQYLNIQRNFW